MRHKAIYALYSNVTSIDGDGDDAKAYDDEGNEVPWDADSVATKETEFQADYNALAYSRKREAEYPSIQECVHAILDDDLTALQEKRQAVKTKYPK